MHSPISPYTPSSPLYPDGLIAPIWVRKHRELVPSVFILILRLYEFDLAANGAIVDDDEKADEANEIIGLSTEREQTDVGPLEKEKVERIRDNELVNEILNRKRACAERGIKLAVVLLTSREMLGVSMSLCPRYVALR